MERVEGLPKGAGRGGTQLREMVAVMRDNPGSWYEVGPTSIRTNLFAHVGRYYGPVEAITRNGKTYARWIEERT